jgi:hypothetical protein
MTRFTTFAAAVAMVFAVASPGFGVIFFEDNFDTYTSGNSVTTESGGLWTGAANMLVSNSVTGMSGNAIDGTTAGTCCDSVTATFTQVSLSGPQDLRFSARVSEISSNQEFAFYNESGDRLFLISSVNPGNLRIYDGAVSHEFPALPNTTDPIDIVATISGSQNLSVNATQGGSYDETIAISAWQNPATHIGHFNIGWDERSPSAPGWNVDNVVLEEIPEPTSLLLAGLGLVGLTLAGRRRRNR